MTETKTERRRRLDQPVTLTVKTVVAIIVVLTLFYAAQGAVLAYFVNENARLAKQGEEAHRYACARKRALVFRVGDSLSILNERPNGIGGISRPIILRGVARDAEEYANLGSVTCDPAVPPLPPIPAA